MRKLITFAWAMTVEVPDDFDAYDRDQYAGALDEAWDRLQKSDGELTDEQDEEDTEESVEFLKDQKRGLYPDKLDPAN